MGINMQQMTCKILRGEGIEFENELKRALDLEGYKTEFWDLPRLFQNPKQYLDTLTENDWIFVPGGFSFADHLGSGRLLAYELEEIKFFEKVLEVGASVWGVCNGFQVLSASGVFGEVQLKHNEFKKRPSNFEDRWVKVYSPVTKEEYFYPVRHGEGWFWRGRSRGRSRAATPGGASVGRRPTRRVSVRGRHSRADEGTAVRPPFRRRNERRLAAD